MLLELPRIVQTNMAPRKPQSCQHEEAGSCRKEGRSDVIRQKRPEERKVNIDEIPFLGAVIEAVFDVYIKGRRQAQENTGIKPTHT